MSRQLPGSGAVLSDQEEEAIRTVLARAAVFGYGNMIGHLQTAWAILLMERYGMDEQGARAGAGGPGYPLDWTRPYMENL